MMDFTVDLISAINAVIKLRRCILWQKRDWNELPNWVQNNIRDLYEFSNQHKTHSKITYIKGSNFEYKVMCPYPKGEHKYYRKLFFYKVLDKNFIFNSNIN